MRNQWHLLLVTGSLAKASIIQGMLEENNIPVQVLNKQDRSYLTFGEIEVYVPFQFKEISNQLLDKTFSN